MPNRRLPPPTMILPKLYVVAVIVAGLAVTIRLVATTSSAAIGGPDVNAFLLFGVLLVIGELRPMDWLLRLEGGEITISWSFAFALVLLSTPAGALAVMGLASALGDTLQRKPVERILFNAAQVMLSLGAGAYLVGRFGLSVDLLSERKLGGMWLPLASLAGAAVFLTNGVLTSVVLALHSGRSILTFMRAAVTSNLALDSMLLALAPILVITARRSLTLVPLLIATIYAVYRSAYLAMSRQHEATHDLLTELPNRRLFIGEATEMIQLAEKRGERLAVVLLDLDGFKAVNDNLGHSTGDRVLRVTADRLRTSLRSRDVVARLGGDEFAILMRDADQEAATTRARRLLGSICEPIELDGALIESRGSFGIALFPEHGDEVDLLLERADIAMYAAKSTADGIEVYTSARDGGAHSRLSLLADMREALDEDQLVLHYQAKVALDDLRVVGVEALVRWQHPRLGLIPPDDFIPMVEASDLVQPFTEYVMNAALAQCAAWERKGMHLPVAVNGSARNVHNPRFVDVVAAALERHGVAASQLEIEITENMVMSDPLRTTAVLQRLRATGVRIALDDFGTGFSSLANLRTLPIDRIKIDKSFVIAMHTSDSDTMIVESIIDLGRNLGLRTVAEGVEDDWALEALRAMRCDDAQGYGITPPLTAEDFDAWFGAWQTEHTPVAILLDAEAS